MDELLGGNFAVYGRPLYRCLTGCWRTSGNCLGGEAEVDGPVQSRFEVLLYDLTNAL
jgi:hypothetical protein